MVAELKDVNGNPVAGVKVKFTIGDLTKTMNTYSTGKAYISTKSLVPGRYVANITCYGDDYYYFGSNTTANVVVYKIGTTLSASDVVATYNDDSRLIVELKDVDGNALGGVRVKFTVGDLTKIMNTYSSGKAYVSTGSLAPGNYVATIKTSGNEYYGGSTTTANVVVNKAGTVLSASNVVVTYNDADGRLVAELKDVNGNAASGVKVKFTVGDLTKTMNTYSTGKAYVGTGSLAPGKYVATITSYENDYYAGSSTTAKIVVNKAGTVLSAEDVVVTYNDADGRLVAELKDVNGNAASGVKVKFTVGDLTKTMNTYSTGKAYVGTSSLNPGSYRATITFDGDDNYIASKATVNVLVNKISTKLTAANVVVIYNDADGRLVAELKDVYGNPVGGFDVKFSVGDLTKTMSTYSSGKAYIGTKSLDTGRYTATVSTEGNEYYAGSSTTAKIVVNKAGTVLSAEDVVVTYNDADGRLVVELKDVNGNPVGGVTVKFTVGDLTKTMSTYSSGKAYVGTKSLAPGKYVATITSSGNDYYYGTTATANVAVKTNPVLSAEDVVVTYNDADGRLVAELKDVDGNPISGVKVKFTVGDLIKTMSTYSTGKAYVGTGSLAPGSYVATITSYENDYYYGANTTAKVVVNKANTVLTTDIVVATYNDDSRLIVDVTDGNGNALSGIKVKFTIGDLTKTMSTYSTGKAYIATNSLNPGIYAATITSYDNDYYYGSTATTYVIVNKADSVLIANDVVATYNDDSRVVVELKDVGGNPISGVKVKFVIGDLTKTMNTYSTGKAYVATKSLTPGNYVASITFDGDDYYSGSTTTAKVTVKKATA